MQTRTATAVACANIAFIKYWGNIDNKLRIPTTGSISMNLAGLETRTTVEFSRDFKGDKLVLNGENLIGEGLARVSHLLDKVRKKARNYDYAQVASENNFPTGSGIASSASAFAALSLAASKATGLSLNMDDLSRLVKDLKTNYVGMAVLKRLVFNRLRLYEAVQGEKQSACKLVGIKVNHPLLYVGRQRIRRKA